MSIEEIREAKDELQRLSADQRQRELYEIRAKKLKDEMSALNKAKREGIEQGLQQGILRVAISLLDILDDETIAMKTGLTLKEVKVLFDNIIYFSESQSMMWLFFIERYLLAKTAYV